MLLREKCSQCTYAGSNGSACSFREKQCGIVIYWLSEAKKSFYEFEVGIAASPPDKRDRKRSGLPMHPLQLQLLSTSWSLSESGLGKVTQANVRQLKPEQWCKSAASPKTSKKYFKKKRQQVAYCKFGLRWKLEQSAFRIGIQAYGFKAQCFRFLNHRFSMNSLFSQGIAATEPSRMVVFAKGCHWNRRKWPLAEHPDSGLDHDSHRPCFAR